MEVCCNNPMAPRIGQTGTPYNPHMFLRSLRVSQFGETAPIWFRYSGGAWSVGFLCS